MPIAEELAHLSNDHPCLWGKINIPHTASWLIEPDARLEPTRNTGKPTAHWWETSKQGALDRQGRPIDALTDRRGSRLIYPLPQLTEEHAEHGQSRRQQELVMYGGSIFEHFGHLLLDLTRTYQLLRLFRRSKEPIWFHYPELVRKSNINPKETQARYFDHPLVDEWLRCLGIRKRARLIRHKLESSMLVSSSVLYRDREFVTTDFPQAARAALAPRLRKRLLQEEQLQGRIAYFSRHKLQQGTTCFEGEQEVVEALAKLSNVDVICPEELSIREKLKLFRRYPLITGFPQAALHLKYFVPFHQSSELASLFLFTAGPQSLNSNWVNLDRVFGFGDRLLDCTPAGEQLGRDNDGSFQRRNPFAVGQVIDTMRQLAEQ
ncbi:MULTISPECIES: glycosyltransferase 61 family protein [unclassified Cyanobium]|uniref:glycosyltransferase 61 family protein n=1 Tax=unclassified Cyanobium TaxID=2627006 RepID=UPI0028F455B0|nr:MULTISPECIES: glycosyltransferase 61 family protein [unclassified Cyanobium]